MKWSGLIGLTLDALALVGTTPVGLALARLAPDAGMYLAAPTLADQTLYVLALAWFDPSWSGYSWSDPRWADNSRYDSSWCNSVRSDTPGVSFSRISTLF